MRKAILLASRGRGKASPNPMVGAVLVKDGEIVGWGYHKGVGTPHAEVVAVRKAGGAKDAILYVNLEPCCHHGRTPPCTRFLINEGIKKVVVATLDPNPLVNGAGVKELMDAGVEVRVGCMKEEAERLNEAYFKYMRTGLPFVILKAALSVDGRITSEQRWITGEESRKYVHRLRASVDAVLVGSGTLVKDDPQLNVRLVRGKNPKKVIVTTSCKIPLEARVFDGEEVIVCTTEKASAEKIKAVQKRGARVIVARHENGMVDLVDAFLRLAKEGIMSLLVEGGRRLFTSIFNLSLFDKLILFLAPKIVGEPHLSFVQTLRDTVYFDFMRTKRVGKDLLCEGYPRDVYGYNKGSGQGL